MMLCGADYVTILETWIQSQKAILVLFIVVDVTTVAEQQAHVLPLSKTPILSRTGPRYIRFTYPTDNSYYARNKYGVQEEKV